MASILLAENAEPVRAALATALTNAGHTVVAVADANRATSELNGNGFDLLVTNLWLPGGGGGDVLRHVRRACPELKTLVLIGEVERLPNIATAAAIAQALGADAVVHVPYGPDDILSIAGRLLADG